MNHLRPIKIGYTGFTLIEIMIAIALLSLLTTAFLHLTDNINKIEIKMLSTVDYLELISKTKLSLSSTKGCQQFLQSAKEKANDIEEKDKHGNKDEKRPIPLNGSLNYLKDTNNNFLIEIGGIYGRNKVTKIIYKKDKNSFNDDSYTLQPGFINLFITLNRGKKLPSIVRKIPISIIANKITQNSDPEIIDCHSQNSKLIRDISKDVAIRVCLSFDATYDELQERCNLETSEAALSTNTTTINSEPSNKISDSELKGITDAVMVNVCRSLGSSYDSSNKKCEINMDSPEMEQFKNIKIDPKQLKEIIQKMAL